MILSNFLTPEVIPLTQISFALLLGMILGIERLLAGRTAGPRTYGLVSAGACLVTILSAHSLVIYGSKVPFDPGHMIGAIITGVGFIGAGLIVLHGSKLSGLTTAAGIWVSAIIGIAVGFQFFLLAAFTTFLTLFVFSIMWRVEESIKKFFPTHFKDEQEPSQE